LGERRFGRDSVGCAVVRRHVPVELPPGAAAVLINRSPTYTDLYLRITLQQKKLFEAIDGRRSIGEIATDPAQRAAARVKEWQAIMDHLLRLPVTKPGELPVIPIDDRAAEVRAINVG
jgi:hypothetical protein